MPRVITFGTFDVFHIGHLNILRRAKELGHHLTVGVSSDQLNLAKKSRPPVYPEKERMAIVAGIRVVDDVFLEDSLELKAMYIERAKADILVMGDDWRGRFDSLGDLCKVLYLPRTASVSTTEVMAKIKRYD